MKSTSGVTSPARFGHPLAWVALILLALLALSLGCRRLFYPYFVDEFWVVRGVWTGERDISPPLLFGLLRGVHFLWRSDAEWLMRLPSLLATAMGVVLLPAWAAIRRWPRSETTAAWLTGGLLALSSPVVFYSAIVKAYALETLFSVWLVAMWIEAGRTPPRARYGLALLVVGSLFVATTYSAIFALAGFAAAFAWRWFFAERRSVAEARIFLGVHILLAAVFLCAYAGWLRYQVSAGAADDPPGSLNRYWATMFWDGSSGFVVRQTRHFIGHQFNLTRGAWLLAGAHLAAWAGALIVRRRRADLAWLLLPATPIGLLLLASRLHLYPYGEMRLMLFTTPLVFALFAHAVSENLGGRSWFRIGAALLTAGFLAVFAFQGLVRDPYATGFMKFTDDRPLHALLRASAAAGDIPVFTGAAEWEALNWYVKPGGVDVRPLADAATIPWTRAWFVVDERGRGEWSFYREQKERLGFAERTRFSRRAGSHAVLAERKGAAP